MLKKMRSIRGSVTLATGCLIAIGAMVVGAVANRATKPDSSVLKVVSSDAKLVWCKMKGKGNTYCNAVYPRAGVVK